MGYHRYYSVSGVIEAHYESAMITYTVKLGGKYLDNRGCKQFDTDFSTGVTHDVINVRYEP